MPAACGVAAAYWPNLELKSPNPDVGIVVLFGRFRRGPGFCSFTRLSGKKWFAV